MINCTLSNYSMTIEIDDLRESASAIDFTAKGVFLTHEELEQLKREAFNAAREEFIDMPGSILELRDWRYEDFNDYLKQRNREQALSELVADGEKNGDYDDQAS